MVNNLLFSSACRCLSPNCVVLICLQAAFELSFSVLIFSPLFFPSFAPPPPSTPLVGPRLPLAIRRDRLMTDVRERVQRGLCVQNLSQPCNYVILCSGFPLKRQSGLADHGMCERDRERATTEGFVFFFFFSASLRLISPVFRPGPNVTKGSNLPERLRKTNEIHLCLAPPRRSSHLSVRLFSDGAAQ